MLSAHVAKSVATIKAAASCESNVRFCTLPLYCSPKNQHNSHLEIFPLTVFALDICNDDDAVIKKRLSFLYLVLGLNSVRNLRLQSPLPLLIVQAWIEPSLLLFQSIQQGVHIILVGCHRGG
jgi:hypothetical protein